MVKYTRDETGHIIITDTETGKSYTLPCCGDNNIIVKRVDHTQKKDSPTFSIDFVEGFELVSIYRDNSSIQSANIVTGFVKGTTQYIIKTEDSPSVDRTVSFIEIWARC